MGVHVCKRAGRGVWHVVPTPHNVVKAVLETNSSRCVKHSKTGRPEVEEKNIGAHSGVKMTSPLNRGKGHVFGSHVASGSTSQEVMHTFSSQVLRGYWPGQTRPEVPSKEGSVGK